MEPINVNLSCDIQQPVKVRYLDGYFFSKDSAGHRINVDVFDNGVPVSVGGSVSAEVVRSDGETVPVTGAVSENRAYVILPQAAYAIVGAVQITIKVTEGTTIVTIACFVAYVHESDTDITVDPGTIIPSIQALISQIETAVASIPADYSSLWTSLAPAFSTSTAYAVGQYVTNSGVLYRFTTAHPAGTWNSAHVTAVNLGSDISALKSAFDSSLDTTPTKNLFDKYTMTDNLLIDGSGVVTTNANYITSDYIKLPIKAVMISSVGTTSTTYKYRIAVYDKNKVWKYRQLATTDDYVMTVNTSVIPATDEYYYIRICFEKARGTNFDTVQVEVGTQKTSYIPHQMPLDWNGRVLIANLENELDEKTAEIETDISALGDEVKTARKKVDTISVPFGVNLFDPTQMIKNTLIDENGEATYSLLYDSSDYIPIQPSTKIIRAFSYTGTPTYRIAFYDSNKDFVFRRTAAYSLWEDGYTLSLTVGCAYARISVENENNTTATVDPFYMVFANGDTISEFVPYFSANDLVARENISEYGAVEHIKDYPKTNEAKLGLNFSWSGNTCFVTGQQSTALCTNVIVDTRAALPAWMEPGQTLYADVVSTKADVRFNLAWYLDGGGNKFDYFTKNDFVTVPDDAIGVIIRLSIPSGASIGSARITCNLFTAGTNHYLSKVAKRITDEFERRVGTVDDATTPMLTIIDDDGNEKFYTDLYPIAVEKKVPIAAAVPFTFMGIANHVTQAQVLEMYANGIEILSHTYSHMYTTEATEQEYERDYQKAKNSYSLIGIPCELLVYAGGSANAANAQEAAKRVYIGAFNSGKEHTNFSDKNDKYNLERYGITDSNDDGRIDGTDLDQLKALIDSVKQTGGWMVWMTHTSGEYWSETMCQNIADVIDYSLAQGVPVVTAAYGFRKYFGV